VGRGWAGGAVHSPELLKLPTEHNSHRTLEGKDLFPAISSPFALPEPEEATHVLLDLRPLHPSPPCRQLPDFCIGRCEKLNYFSLYATLAQKHFSITEHLH